MHSTIYRDAVSRFKILSLNLLCFLELLSGTTSVYISELIR